MKTIAIAWIVVVALRGLMYLLAQSVSPSEYIIAKYTRKPPRRYFIAFCLYVVSITVAVIVTIIEIVLM